MENVDKEIANCKPKIIKQITLSKTSITDVSKLIAKSISSRINKDVAAITAEVVTKAANIASNGIAEIADSNVDNTSGEVDSFSEMDKLQNFILSFGALKDELANVHETVKKCAVENQALRNDMTEKNVVYEQALERLIIEMESLCKDNCLLNTIIHTLSNRIPGHVQQEALHDDVIESLQSQLDYLHVVLEEANVAQMRLQETVYICIEATERDSYAVGGMKPLLRDLLQSAMVMQGELAQLKDSEKKNRGDISSLAVELKTCKNPLDRKVCDIEMLKNQNAMQTLLNKMENEIKQLHLQLEKYQKDSVTGLSIPGAFHAQASFQYTVLNIGQLCATHLSPAFYVRMLSWKLKLEPHDSFLSINLTCRCNQMESWSCQAFFAITLKCHLPGAKSYPMLKGNRCFDNVKREAGNEKAISFKELLDPTKGYVQDNSITLQISLWANEPKGVVIGYFSNNLSVLEENRNGGS